MAGKKLIMGCDDAALPLKNEIADFLRKKGYEIEDLGINTASDSTCYPAIAEKVAVAVTASGGEKRGILICGTGIGMAMAANKVKGVRAAVIHDAFSAERAALSNDANIVCLGARVIGSELAKKMLMEWLPLEFKPGPSSVKVDAIMDIEKRFFK